MTIVDALVLDGIHHQFGTTTALQDASLRVRRGTLHALLGENGAGKTTLMRIAFGMLAPTRGRVLVRGRVRAFKSSAEAIADGIGMVHQHFKLIPALTVTENVELGGRGALRLREAGARLSALAARVGLSVDPAARVEDLPVSSQQRVEILKALARDAELLLLDEPTAVLSPDEATALLEWVRRFVDGGGTAVLITHKLREALRFADEVSVLRRGTTTFTGRVPATNEAALVAALTGSGDAESAAPGAAPVRAPGARGGPVLTLDRISYTDPRGFVRLRDVTLEIHAGEVVGVIGVEGSGHRELLRVLAGRLQPTLGRVHGPERVGFVPEDRLADALVASLTVTENVALAGAGRARGRLDWDALRRQTESLLVAADVRGGGAHVPVATLSGGNQQRLVIARERAVASTALVADHPTRGLDLRASARVLDELRRAASEDGTAVVMHSPDLDEVRSVATRVVACFAGSVREVPWPADPQDRAPFARALVGAT